MTNKIFIDTSIFIRFFTQDIQEKYRDCEKLFEVVEEGNYKPYTSNIVLFEIFFVLTTKYRFAKVKVKKALAAVLQMRNLTMIEKTNTPKALQLLDKYKIKYADCLIATQIPDKTRLVTYDEDFKKIPTITVETPADVIESLISN